MTVIKEYVSKDTSNRTRIFVEVQCELCNNTFIRQKRQLKVHACSAACRNALAGNTVELECSNCGVPFFRAKSKLSNSKSGHYFL
jgi:formylmethanofuran dehydrogenase subunit E